MLQRDVLLVHHAVCLQGGSDKGDTCRDSGADRNLTTTIPMIVSKSMQTMFLLSFI